MHLRHGDCSKYVHGICTLIIGTDVRCIAYAMRKFKTQTIDTEYDTGRPVGLVLYRSHGTNGR